MGLARKNNATAMSLPIVVGQPVKVKLNGKSVQTAPEKINRIEYMRGVMYVTFTSSNSIYEKVPVKIKALKSYRDGEVIEKGSTIKTMTYSTQVESIEQILEDKIIIRDKSDNVFATAIFLEQ